MTQRVLKLDSAGLVQKWDRAGSVDSIERTPQGGIKAVGYPTRTGVLEYVLPNGTVSRQYRPPEEVFKADSLATLEAAPVTDNHPYQHGGFVTPENFKALSCGHVQGPAQDGGRVKATVYLQDKTLIGKVIKRDSVELSCGYLCREDWTPGVTPEGEKYDCIHRDIRYNHVAVVPKGRAGSEIRIKLDSSGRIAPDSEENRKEKQPMLSIKIDGVDYPLGTEAEIKAAVAAFDRYTKAQSARLDSLTAERDAALAKADAAKADAAKALAPETLAAAVKAKLALIDAGTKALGTEAMAKLDSDDAIRNAVIAKVYPGLKLDGKSQDYAAAMFDAACATLAARTAADPGGVTTLAQALNTPTAPASPKLDKAEEARAKMLEENAKAWEKPLALSK